MSSSVVLHGTGTCRSCHLSWTVFFDGFLGQPVILHNVDEAAARRYVGRWTAPGSRELLCFACSPVSKAEHGRWRGTGFANAPPAGTSGVR